MGRDQGGTVGLGEGRAGIGSCACRGASWSPRVSPCWLRQARSRPCFACSLRPRGAEQLNQEGGEVCSCRMIGTHLPLPSDDRSAPWVRHGLSQPCLSQPGAGSSGLGRGTSQLRPTQAPELCAWAPCWGAAQPRAKHFVTVPGGQPHCPGRCGGLVCLSSPASAVTPAPPGAGPHPPSPAGPAQPDLPATAAPGNRHFWWLQNVSPQQRMGRQGVPWLPAGSLPAAAADHEGLGFSRPARQGEAREGWGRQSKAKRGKVR